MSEGCKEREGSAGRRGGRRQVPPSSEISFLAQKRRTEQCMTHFPAVGRNNVSAAATIFIIKNALPHIFKKYRIAKNAMLTHLLFDGILKFQTRKGEIVCKITVFTKKVLESAAASDTIAR